MKNLKEFEELIHTYNSITLEEIENSYYTNIETSQFTAHRLTGFGHKDTCTLCKSASNNCNKCIWAVNIIPAEDIDYYPCNCDGTNKYTYYAIDESETPTQLLEAFKNRALHMKNHLKQIRYEQQEGI